MANSAFSQPQIPNPVPVANGGTGNTGGAWTAYTPTVVYDPAGNSAADNKDCAYMKIGRTVFVRIKFRTTYSSTAPTYCTVTLPSGCTPIASQALAGVNGSTGKALRAEAFTDGKVYVSRYDFTNPIEGTTYYIAITGVYECVA